MGGKLTGLERAMKIEPEACSSHGPSAGWLIHFAQNGMLEQYANFDCLFLQAGYSMGVVGLLFAICYIGSLLFAH
jgi:hypothetical protein